MAKPTTTPTAHDIETPDELVKRPNWLPNGCPSWCETSDLHRDGDHPDDREHIGEGVHIELSVEAYIDGCPSTVNTHIARHYRETGARIWVGHDGSSAGKYLTVDEAREFALRILELTKVVDGI